MVNVSLAARVRPYVMITDWEGMVDKPIVVCVHAFQHKKAEAGDLKALMIRCGSSSTRSGSTWSARASLLLPEQCEEPGAFRKLVVAKQLSVLDGWLDGWPPSVLSPLFLPFETDLSRRVHDYYEVVYDGWR